MAKAVATMAQAMAGPGAALAGAVAGAAVASSAKAAQRQPLQGSASGLLQSPVQDSSDSPATAVLALLSAASAAELP